MISLVALLLVLSATLTGAIGIVGMKRGAARLEFRLSSVLRNNPLLVGVGFFCLSTCFFIASLRFGDLHVLYAMTGLTYVWLLILSWKLLGEPLNKMKILGTVLIILGVVLLSL